MPEYPETSTSSGAAALDDAVEGGEQGIDLARSPVQLLGDQQPVWRVVFAKRKLVDAALSFPFGKAAPKITLDAGGSLVSLLGGLGEQLHDDCETGAGIFFNRSLGGTGFLAIWQWTHSMGSDAVNGSDAREHLVERDAK